ncbi:hypothetical protein F2Q70_00018127 [Brassica cretica]|uniref:Uncharacterized protein n=1 Tax=Brassica cretica TaxID=69181 RepID=A0A8S9HWK4_BRACR|nr:hypothetical protein F2Q70_00018127 [Brassica cretica]
MVEKANRCFGRVRDHFTRLDAFGKAKNLYGQASGTKKCLEMIKASGTEIPQEMIDVFAEQEKLHEAKATKLCVGPQSDSDLTLSPLVLPSRFVGDRFRVSFDPYGSNVNLIRPETASQLITSLEITEEPSGEPLVDITSVPAEHVEVPEGGGLDERPENENLDEDPVLVSDSSSEGREDEDEEDYRVEETSPPQPVEEETTNKVGDRDVTKLSPPTMDSLVLFLLEWKTRLLPLLKTQSVLRLLGCQRRTIKILCLDALPMFFLCTLCVYGLDRPCCCTTRHTFILSIPQEMIDVFAELEKLHEAEATKLCVGPLSDSDLTLSPLVLPSRFVEDRFRASFDPYGSNVNLIRPETASQLITSLKITEAPSGEPLVEVTSVPAEHVEVPEGGGLDERPENENLEEVPGKDYLETGDTLVREKETKNVGIEDPVLVSDSSSEGREDEEEEDDRVVETSPPQPVEEETTNEVGDRDVQKPSPPTVDSLVPVPTRVEDPAAAATEDPVDPPALGTREEDDQDSAP